MAIKNFSQKSLVEYKVDPIVKKTKTYKFLSKIEKIIDWNPINSILETLRSSRFGAPAYPPLLMFKILLLQRWYSLSDPAMEDALNDRLSFKIFVGLPTHHPAPDETTIVRFRAELQRAKIFDLLFKEINRQLEEKGLFIKEGSIIDASFIQAAVKPPTKKEKEVRKFKDPDAEWGVKEKENGERIYCYGYKLHISIDKDTQMVSKFTVSSANEHDLTRALEIIDEGTKELYADKGYSSKDFEEKLSLKKIKAHIMKKKPKEGELSHEEKKENKRISLIRRKVEKVFGTIKENWNHRRTRYIGLKKNLLHYGLIVIAYNLKRATNILLEA